MYRSLGLPIHRYSDFISVQDRQSAGLLAAQTPLNEIDSYELDGLAVGEHAMAGVAMEGMALWSDLTEFEVYPVLSSSEAALRALD